VVWEGSERKLTPYPITECGGPCSQEQRSVGDRRSEESNESFAPVSRLELMPDGQDQDYVFGREPAILRDIPVPAAREDEFSPALLGRPSEKGMIGQELKCFPHAQNLFTRPLGIFGGDEVKEPFEVGERPLGYLDRRHARALGRRAFAPEARAVK
jgi:hypothetical protein